MGYQVGQFCYVDTITALDAFRETFPLIDGNGLVSHVSSSITVGGQVSYSVAQRAWSSNTLNSRTGTIQLVACTDVDAPSAFDPAVAGSIFAVFFIGVVGTYLLSANIGLILEGIKKW